MQRSASKVAAAHQAILQFLEQASQPAVLESGSAHILLARDHYSVTFTAGRLSLEAWNETTSIHRRIVDIEQQTAGRLTLTIERFGKKTGTIELIDLSRLEGKGALRREQRHNDRERFRASLLRHHPSWHLQELTTETDLERSLSPVYPRALLRYGSRSIAAIGAYSSGTASGVLTFGLIWLDYVRRREPELEVSGLHLFVPRAIANAVGLLLAQMRRDQVTYRLFVVDESVEVEVDLKDFGNIDTHVAPLTRDVNEGNPLITGLAHHPDLDFVGLNDGGVSLRIRGLEIASLRGGVLRFGLETKHKGSASNVGEILDLANAVAASRHSAVRDQRSPLYAKYPEAWLESQVRRNPAVIDANLQAEPIYGQVPALAASDRGLIDLLGISNQGRMAVMELKAEEDIELPMQGLEYWLRVKWHKDRGDFERNGYFPEIPLAAQDPKLFLVSPALHFHPRTETILSYWKNDIEVERIGVGMNWRETLQVAFRLRGAETR